MKSAVVLLRQRWFLSKNRSQPSHKHRITAPAGATNRLLLTLLRLRAYSDSSRYIPCVSTAPVYIRMIPHGTVQYTHSRPTLALADTCIFAEHTQVFAFSVVTRKHTVFQWKGSYQNVRIHVIYTGTVQNRTAPRGLLHTAAVKEYCRVLKRSTNRARQYSSDAFFVMFMIVGQWLKWARRGIKMRLSIHLLVSPLP